MKISSFKIWWLGGLVAGLCCLFASLGAQAQITEMPYIPFYWILGTVSDSDSIKADGHVVVFYKDDSTYLTNNSQAIIKDNRFILNAFNIYPLELKVGETYKLAIVKDSNGWGMNPMNVVISGKGYDEVSGSGKVDKSDFTEVGVDPDKVIKDLKDNGYIDENGNITSKFDGNLENFKLPGYIDEQLKEVFDVLKKEKDGLDLKKNEGTVQPPPPTGETWPEPLPVIKFWFGSRVYQKALVEKGEEFIVPSKLDLKIDLSITAPFTLSKDIGSYSIVIDPGTPGAKNLTLGAQHMTQKVFAAGAAEEEKISSFSLRYSLAEDLSEGKHIILARAKSSGALGVISEAAETASVEVMGGPLRLVGTPLTYPSPFSISKQKTVTIQYGLSANANIEIYLTGVGGLRIKRFILNSGGEGGSAGINKVTWDGMTDQGFLAGNAIYVGTITARDEGRLLGKVKLTIVD